MNWADVAKEIRTALSGIEGLRTPPYGDPSAALPFAAVGLPDTVSYDATYGRGKDTWNLRVFLIVGPPNERSSANLAGEYAAGSGDRSVKAAIEAGTYAACDRPRVTGCIPHPDATWQSAPVLMLEFTCIFTGPGVTP